MVTPLRDQDTLDTWGLECLVERAFRVGDMKRAEELQRQIVRVSELLYHIGRHSSSIIKGIKCGLSCLGVCDDFMAEPFHRFRPAERAVVEERIRELEAMLHSVI